ncbi:MAG TPA: hypothetical protein VH951_10265 [Dehalococcoidia bacterium]
MTSGGPRTGSGAPYGNTNAMKSGRYSPRFIRGAAVLSLAPSLREVFHALRRNNRALGGDTAARWHHYLALVAAAQRLGDQLFRADPLFVEFLGDLIGRIAPGSRVSRRPATPAHPERDPIITGLLVIINALPRNPDLARPIDGFVVERLALLLENSSSSPQIGEKQKQSNEGGLLLGLAPHLQH